MDVDDPQGASFYSQSRAKRPGLYRCTHPCRGSIRDEHCHAAPAVARVGRPVVYQAFRTAERFSKAQGLRLRYLNIFVVRAILDVSAFLQAQYIRMVGGEEGPVIKIFVPLGVPADDLHDKMVGGCRGSGVSFDFERGGAAGQNVHQPAQAFGRGLLAGRNVYLVFGALVARPGVFPRRRDIALYFDTRPEPTFETGLHRSVRTVGLFGLFGGRYLHLEVDVHRVDQQRRDRHQPQERSLDVDRIGRYTGRGLDGAFQLEFQQIGWDRSPS